MANQQAFAGHKFFNLNSAFAPLALTSLDLSHKYYHGFQAFFLKKIHFEEMIWTFWHFLKTIWKIDKNNKITTRILHVIVKYIFKLNLN